MLRGRRDRFRPFPTISDRFRPFQEQISAAMAMSQASAQPGTPSTAFRSPAVATVTPGARASPSTTLVEGVVIGMPISGGASAGEHVADSATTDGQVGDAQWLLHGRLRVP